MEKHQIADELESAYREMHSHYGWRLDEANVELLRESVNSNKEK